MLFNTPDAPEPPTKTLAFSASVRDLHPLLRPREHGLGVSEVVVAEAALKHAGAQSSVELGPVEADTDYVWGDPVALKDVIAGDILQFRDFVVVTRTVAETTFRDGSGDTETVELAVERRHHTAIVGAVLGMGAFQILNRMCSRRGKSYSAIAFRPATHRRPSPERTRR
jgi:hypothetical protein